jgi:NAD+ synthase (glutamine-hydrolysing)
MRMRLEHDLYIHPGRGNARSDPRRGDERCREVYQIQLQGLVKQPQATGIQRFVIGIADGLDSTFYVLLVCAQSRDLLGYPCSNTVAYTMPRFATTARTLKRAPCLMQAILWSARQNVP